MRCKLKHRLAAGQVFTGPNGETLRHDVGSGGEQVVMESPRTGRHVLDFHASSSGRIAAHWRGFTRDQEG